MLKTIQKGFTLIELAIVIAILGILAAVALNNLGNTQAAAECSMVKDMAAQLQSGYATYTAAEGMTPPGFTNYVINNATTFTRTGTGNNVINPSISLVRFGPGATRGNPCAVAAATITCTDTFNNYTPVTYNFNNGAVTFTATTKSGATGVTPCI